MYVTLQKIETDESVKRQEPQDAQVKPDDVQQAAQHIQHALAHTSPGERTHVTR